MYTVFFLFLSFPWYSSSVFSVTVLQHFNISIVSKGDACHIVQQLVGTKCLWNVLKVTSNHDLVLPWKFGKRSWVLSWISMNKDKSLEKVSQKHTDTEYRNKRPCVCVSRHLHDCICLLAPGKHCIQPRRMSWLRFVRGNWRKYKSWLGVKRFD